MLKAAPALLAILLATSACSTWTSSSSRVAGAGDLTPENAALVATVAANAPDEKVRDLIPALGESGLGVERVSYPDPLVLLLAFRADATVEQRRAVFGRLAATGYFSSIQCSSCSPHGRQPSAPPG